MIDHTTDSTRTSRPGDLARLGDDLERAFARDLVATPRAPCRSAWRRKAVIVPASSASAIASAGAMRTASGRTQNPTVPATRPASGSITPATTTPAFSASPCSTLASPRKVATKGVRGR